MEDNQHEGCLADERWILALNRLASISTRLQGFELLYQLTVPYLRLFLSLKNVPEGEHEEVISEVRVRLINKIESTTFSDRKAWMSYVKHVAINFYIDQQRSSRNRLCGPLDHAREIQSESESNVASALETSEEHRSLLRQLNDLWLGQRSSQFRLKLLAAKLLFWDKRSFSDVVAILHRCQSSLHIESPRMLVEWISEERVLRQLCFQRISLHPEKLLDHVLKRAKSELRSMDDLHHAVLVWRFGNYETRSQVISKLKSDFPEEEIIKVLDLYENYLPFQQVGDRVWESLQPCPNRESSLAHPGLWKNVAVFYHIHNLSQNDFNSWVSPAAKRLGFEFKPNTMHSWFSNRLLSKEIKCHLEEQSW